MQQQTIPELIQERQTVARQVAELNKRLETLDRELFSRFTTMIQALGGGFSANAIPHIHGAAASYNTQLSMFKTKAGRRQTIGRIIEDAAVPILRDHGPMRLSELLKALANSGVDVPGTKPANNLSAHLSRSAKFKRAGDGWTVAENKEPPGGGS